MLEMIGSFLYRKRCRFRVKENSVQLHGLTFCCARAATDRKRGTTLAARPLHLELGAAQTRRCVLFASARVHALRLKHGRGVWPREELDQCFRRLRFLCRSEDACRKSKVWQIL